MLECAWLCGRRSRTNEKRSQRVRVAMHATALPRFVARVSLHGQPPAADRLQRGDALFAASEILNHHRCGLVFRNLQHTHTHTHTHTYTQTHTHTHTHKHGAAQRVSESKNERLRVS
jgi:hypothetical protein